MHITITLSADETIPETLAEFLASALKHNGNTIECVNETPETQPMKNHRRKFITRDKVRETLTETDWKHIEGVSIDEFGNTLLPLKVFQNTCSSFASRTNVNNILFGRSGKDEGILSELKHIQILKHNDKWSGRVLKIMPETQVETQVETCVETEPTDCENPNDCIAQNTAEFSQVSGGDESVGDMDEVSPNTPNFPRRGKHSDDSIIETLIRVSESLALNALGVNKMWSYSIAGTTAPTAINYRDVIGEAMR